MLEKVLNLLLLFVILSQEVIGNLTHENIIPGKPWDTLIRQKRVINRIPGEDKKVKITSAPYLVHIKERMRIKCLGNILSSRVVITISTCVLFEPSDYTVVSSSSYSNKGSLNNVTDIKKYLGNHPGRPTDGVVLLTVAVPFVFDRYSAPIQLHSGSLVPGRLGTVHGWGFNFRKSDRGTAYPRNLRSIEVPILAHMDCVNVYEPLHIEITAKDICTYHPQKYCGHTDGGAPLVVDGFLVGIHLWTGTNISQVHCSSYPDVFVFLQYSEYNQWIRSTIRNIEEHFENRHNS